LRDECLNEEVFGSLAEAGVVIERWRLDYNTSGRTRPTAASPPTLWLNLADGRLRNSTSSAARLRPPATETRRSDRNPF